MRLKQWRLPSITAASPTMIAKVPENIRKLAMVVASVASMLTASVKM
jgi:hypothetical protein